MLECSASWEFNRRLPLPGTAYGWLHPGWSTRRLLRPVQYPRMAEADRIAEFKEVAVFLHQLEKAAP
jgi:hypothetical protein